MSHPDRISVVVEEDLLDLIPGFLENRRGDIRAIRGAVSRGDLETARRLGHSMKGSGGGYGFDRITEIGAALEIAAGSGDLASIERELAALANYLDRVEVVSE